MVEQFFSIKNCEFAFKCPRDWPRLTATANGGERHCASCDKLVYLCQDNDALIRHVQAGHCVAVEDVSHVGRMLVGQVESEYSAPPPELAQASDKPYLGLKITPSSFDQRVDASVYTSIKFNWD